jgi:hypothetical protein
MHVSVGLLESHDPARGRVIVHPTPGASSPQALAHDLLGALGRAVNRLNAEQLAGAAAGRAVTAWMVTDQIEDLVVLRADRLSAGAWTWVLGLCRETGSRLLLVCHTRQIPAHLNTVLAGTGYQLLIGLPQALRAAGPRPRSRPDGAAGAGPDAADLPRFLHPHIRNYRSKAFAQLGPARVRPDRRRLPAGARDQLAALLPIRERVLGPEHPKTLSTRNQLARWTGQAGDAAGARAHLTPLTTRRGRA